MRSSHIPSIRSLPLYTARYWTVDQNALNEHFGTASDLNNLATALHDRGMYLMVDIVVNHVMVTSTTNPDYSNCFFKDAVSFRLSAPETRANRVSGT